VSSGSFQASDECDAADCNPLRDRTFEVLPDVVPNEWPGEKTKPSEGINRLPRRDHTEFDSPVKRKKATDTQNDDRAAHSSQPEDPVHRAGLSLASGAGLVRPSRLPALATLFLCRREATSDLFPVQCIPPGGRVIGPAILVLEVIGVFPHVQAEDRG
jgi:hypothetical protein